MTEETKKTEQIEKALEQQTDQIENPTELQGEDLEKVAAGTYLKTRSNTS